ncbi:MAG: hypothetical protein LQ340_005496 [Diploschistes diacapsis]|nr:MAG: hypothetical protein LQ340_005496 [Diploschistes diacapsis]
MSASVYGAEPSSSVRRSFRFLRALTPPPSLRPLPALSRSPAKRKISPSAPTSPSKQQALGSGKLLSEELMESRMFKIPKATLVEDQGFTYYKKELSSFFVEGIKKKSSTWASIGMSIAFPGTVKEFQELDEIVTKMERRWPRVTYISSVSRIKIVSYPGAVHDKIAAAMGGCFWRSIATLSDEVQERIDASHSPTSRLTNETYRHSKLEADYTFIHRPTDKPSICAVLEIAVSETIDSVRETACAWLGGMDSMQLVIIVKVTEIPAINFSSRVLAEFILGKIWSEPEWDWDELDDGEKDPTRPMSYRDVGLVNPMEMFVELWRKGNDGVPAQSGNRMIYDHQNPSTEALLTYGDLYPITVEEGANTPFPLSWYVLDKALRLGRQDFARERWGDVRERMEEQESGKEEHDPDYEPSTEDGEDD